MSKKMMLLALAVVSAAMFALPAVASAQFNHIDEKEAFSITGSGGTLTGPVHVSCNGTTGSGSLSTTTEGTATLKFFTCVDSVFGFHCKSPGASAGTIEVANKFDLIRAGAAASSPGALLTPDTGVFPTSGSASSELKSLEQFVIIECSGITLKVIGKGVIGTFSASVCSELSKSATLTFTSSATGTQAHQTWTGGSYDLKAGANHSTASLDGAATLTFAKEHKTSCT